MKNGNTKTNGTDARAWRGGRGLLLTFSATLITTIALAGPAQAQGWGTYRNQAPYAPTVHGPANTWDQPTPLDPTFGGMVRLSWRTNGDPEGDRVDSSLQVYRWDATAQQWIIVVNTGLHSTSNEFAYGLKYSTGDLLPGTYYVWRAFAIDSTQRSNPWYAGSDWQKFLTPGKQTPPEQGQAIVVPANQKTKVTSQPLQAGRQYVIEVSGTFSVWDKSADGVDAVYCYRGGVAQWNQLRIDDQGLADLAGAIAYNDQHVYRIYYTGQGKALTFHIIDAFQSPGDNSGSITVRIR